MHAKHRAELAESIATRAEKDKAELEAIVKANSNELRIKLGEMQARLSVADSRIDRALQFTSGGDSKFWSRPVETRFEDYQRRIADSIPILLFGNQKGGVGKSTLVSNVAAAFANRGERVLTVDLDYQGSHSSLAQLQLNEGEKEPQSLIDFLFEDELALDWPT